MKKNILAIIFCLTLTQATASNLVQVDMKKVSDSVVDVTLYTTDISLAPMVTKKPDNKYVILMPNVSGNTASNPNFSSLKDIITDVDVKSVDDGMSGYTKVTLTTTKPIEIKTNVQKAAPISAEEKIAKSIIAQVKTKPVVAQTPKVNASVSAEKPAEVKKDTNVNNNKLQQKITEKPVVNNVVNAPKKVEDVVKEPQVKDVASETVENAETLSFDKKNENFTKEEKTSSNKSGWMLLALPLLLLFSLAKMAKNSVLRSNVLKESFKEHLSERPYEEEKYDDIISDSDLNWQQKYKKFQEKSSSVDSGSNYNLVKPLAITDTDMKRVELEGLLEKDSEYYKDLDIDISENNLPEIQSEDFVIQDEMSKTLKLKAFAKPATLTASHRANVTKLLPKYSHAKEGKYIKLLETPLHSTSRKFVNANLNVSDLINTGSKYLKDSNEDIEMIEREQNYLMSSIDEYFTLLDKEDTKRMTNPNKDLSKSVAASIASIKPSMAIKNVSVKKVSNPIVQKSKDYSQGLVIKESYHVDSARSFHVVNLDGVAALIGRINEDITVIKKFDSSEVGKMQVRRDAENVYIVKVGYFKSLIDANNMGVLIEL